MQVIDEELEIVVQAIKNWALRRFINVRYGATIPRKFVIVNADVDRRRVSRFSLSAESPPSFSELYQSGDPAYAITWNMAMFGSDSLRLSSIPLRTGATSVRVYNIGLSQVKLIRKATSGYGGCQLYISAYASDLLYTARSHGYEAQSIYAM